MNNKLLIISILIFFIPSLSYQDELIKDIIDTPKIINIIDYNEIDLGYAIKETRITLSLNDDPNSNCYLRLIDDILNEIKISSIFPCDGTNIISLNQLGNYAFENNLYKKSFGFNIVKIQDTKKEIDFQVLKLEVTTKAPQYFAEIQNDKVISVIVADQSYIDTISGQWVETKLDGSLRGGYAGIGYDYNPIKDQFENPFKIIDEIIIPPSNETGT